MWPLNNLQRIWQSTQALAQKDSIYFTYVNLWSGGHQFNCSLSRHSSNTPHCCFIKQQAAFAPTTEAEDGRALQEELDLSAVDSRLHYIPPEQNLADVDIIIATTHGSDESKQCWQMRHELKESALFLNWMIDNHLGHLNNLRTVLAADYLFPSHDYIKSYLLNPASILLKFVPAAPLQWQTEEYNSLISNNFTPPPSNAVINYWSIM